MIEQILSQAGNVLFKILLTILLSSIIGIERFIRHKGAGLRTHILIGVGSALLVLTSFHLFDIYKEANIVDPTRIIAGIVTGVGFLCAGTIIRGGTEITGLTTAASMWVVSGIGMAVAAGQYGAAVIVTFVVFLTLIGLRSIEKKIEKIFRP
ncbi:MAG: MgtC/SapB family protein [Candidatus Omnitrophica bacterium]|nr:MgtC/SapB family protein [Candidatus Omnitrophota bacterium]